ncbi:MAG TPA: hypothetical protein VMM38_06730 [Aridibacter sp.]|nr:hypothetical protein [Aridibacter sp.]
MLKHSYKVITLAIILTVSAVIVSGGSAVSSDSITFEVPFDFQIGNDKFEKGTYRVSRENQNTVLIESLESSDAAFILAGRSGDRLNSFSQSQLKFYRYGERYFLREVNSPAVSAEISESKSEKAVRKKGYEKLAKVSVKGKKAR